MSSLSILAVQGFRNLSSLRLDTLPRFNLFVGSNGSGKTSILESIYLLSSGRSFRTSRTESVIQHDLNETVIFGQLDDGSTIGLSRARGKPYQLKLNGESRSNWDAVAKTLPVQILDAGAFALLEGGPKARRRFLDWGVFHVEPGFVENWRRTRKCLAQRNHLLKSGAALADLAPWDSELSTAADAVHQARERYFQLFQPVLQTVCDDLLPVEGLSARYARGWKDGDLKSLLEAGYPSDRKIGATQQGPHRADVTVRVGSRSAIEVLSRGQQKLLVSAMKIAQGIVLSESLEKQCVYLVDDLPSELDAANRTKVLQQLQELPGQLFVTCVEQASIALPQGDLATFHVEHGIIQSPDRGSSSA